MPTERWHRLEELFKQALEQPAGARADFVRAACGPDADTVTEVVSLLNAVDRSGDFLAAPALDVFARQISREGWSVQPGDRIGSYTIACRIGAGGMGEVWRARDDRLGRDVAIKLLLPHATTVAERLRAFEREARAVGTLNHPNVLTVHDVGEHHGAPFLVTECLEGQSLRARLRSGTVAVDATLDIAAQVARGLGAAHARGIVHRDLKPENIFLASDGRVKILDFGLASLHDAAPAAPRDAARSLAAGTAGYMAPEQVRGASVDHRADIFAFGAVVYEMLVGRPPYQAASVLGTLEAVLTTVPPDLLQAAPAIPPRLSAIVHRCLEQSPAARFATIGELSVDLDAAARALSPPPPGLLATLRRPRTAAVLLAMVLAIAVGGWRSRAHASRVRWARTIAAPEIQRLADDSDYSPAFLLARQALDILPDDPQLRQLWLEVSVPASISSDPPGADVAFTPYRSASTDWFPLGRTPFTGVRVPRTPIHVRISKAGFQTIEGSFALPAPRYRLDPLDAVPPGMVRVVGGRDPVRVGLASGIGDYWIDRFEITNQQFKAFVEAGGYSRREYWREPFTDGDRTMAWEEAAPRFRDATGQPGPATWRSGTFPSGEAGFPVGGVSWYEATAYAAYAGKSLPTIHHWFGAARLERFADILTASNFAGRGSSAVGRYRGLGPFGTYDMAGNVKEWCSTQTSTRRFIAGGAWNEPQYTFAEYDAREPFERTPSDGFRLVKYDSELPALLAAPVEIAALTDGSRRKPVGEDIFEVYRRQYAYDKAPVNAVVEEAGQTDSSVTQRVTFDAADGAERVRAYLFLPKHVAPPYQTVVFFPPSDAFQLASSRDMSLTWMHVIVGSGRAFLYPIYKGTYERRGRGEAGPNAERDLRIAWSRDLGRALDYLETRSDIDSRRVGFYGVSAGAEAGVILVALEPRLKTAVFQGNGLTDGMMPEIDTINYAPRIRIPVLLLDGRYDFDAPREKQSHDPLFDLLGSPADRKQHTILEAGHALPMANAAREILPWLDRYLGPVSRSPAR
jgi:eukaryotic-like serine/threonine-protein kinase